MKILCQVLYKDPYNRSRLNYFFWFILAHQMVKKLDANTYSTDMNGIKLKIAHKRSDKAAWNISDATQRKYMVKMLKDYIKELEAMELEDFVASERTQVKKSAKKSPKEMPN